ncbi:hypothetical protein NSQ26_09630 [Bacillus sp. FSL W7-1360]
MSYGEPEGLYVEIIYRLDGASMQLTVNMWLEQCGAVEVMDIQFLSQESAAIIYR